MSVVIQSGFTGNAQPIDQPRICFDKHTATATASGTASGYDPALVTDGETWSLWRASTFTSTLTITFASNQSTNYAALGAHNLGSGSSDVQLQTSTDGSTFVNATGISSHSPTDDSAIVWLFETASLRAIRFSFSGGFLPPTIGVAQAGEALEMPQLSVFTGLPISESKQVRYRHQQSITGDVLGRAVEGADLRFDLTVQNLPETFRAAVGDITWKALSITLITSGRSLLPPSRLAILMMLPTRGQQSGHGLTASDPTSTTAEPSRSSAWGMQRHDEDR